MELTEEEKERKAKKAVADEHKAKGNDAYKAKKFDEAVTHYSAAIEALPDEMTYYNNLAAVFFEQKKFDECIEKCKKAIEIGRSMRADYKVVAKSFARIGNAYKAMDKLDEAKRAYEDSLMEDRVEDVEKRLKNLSKGDGEARDGGVHQPGARRGGAAGGQRALQARAGRNDISLYAKAIAEVRRRDEAQPEGPRAVLEPRGVLPEADGVAAGAEGRGQVRRDGADVCKGLVAQGGHPLLPEGVPQGDGRVQRDPQARAGE